MDVTIRYFDGCPNWKVAEARVREVVVGSGSPVGLRYERVETPEEAEQLRFHGSPTILVDGVDPFADESAPVGLSCRIYRTGDGPDGAPSVRQLREVIGA